MFSLSTTPIYVPSPLKQSPASIESSSTPNPLKRRVSVVSDDGVVRPLQETRMPPVSSHFANPLLFNLRRQVTPHVFENLFVFCGDQLFTITRKMYKGFSHQKYFHLPISMLLPLHTKTGPYIITHLLVKGGSNVVFNPYLELKTVGDLHQVMRILNIFELPRHETILFEDLKSRFLDYSFVPQMGDFIPKITQRVIKSTKYNKNSTKKRGPTSSNAGPSHSAFVNPRRNPTSILEDIDYLPQMNALMSMLGVSNPLSSIPTHYTVDHVVDMTSMSDIVNKLSNPTISLNPSEKLLDTATSISNNADNIVSNISSAISSGSVSRLVMVMSVIIFAYKVYADPSTSNIRVLTILMGVCVMFGILNSEHVIDITKQLQSKLFPDKPTPQMLSTNIIASVLTAILAVMGLKTTKKSIIEEGVSLALNFKKNSDSMEYFVSFGVAMIEWIVNVVRTHMLGSDSIMLTTTGRVDIDEFILRCTTLKDDIHYKRLAYTISNSHKVHELWMTCNSLIASLKKDTPPSLVATLNNLLHYLSSVKKEFEAMNLSTQGVRIEPTTVLMRGAPGVGKSNLMAHFSTALLHSLVPPEKREQLAKDPQSFVFNLQSENVYWESYNSDKLITYVDDIGQPKDVAGNPDSEWMKLIRMASLFEYVLHMAGIDKKGNTRFCSKVILINTNRRDFQVESIVEVEAAKRRCDLVFDVCPKIEYTKDQSQTGIWARRLDWTKLPMGDHGVTKLTPDVSEFHEIDFMASTSGEPTGKVYDFDTVIKMVLSVVDMKSKRFDQLLLDLSNTKLKYQPQMFADYVFKKNQARESIIPKLLEEHHPLIVLPFVEKACEVTGNDYLPNEWFDRFLYARFEDPYRAFLNMSPEERVALVTPEIVQEVPLTYYEKSMCAYDRFKQYVACKYDNLPPLAKDVLKYGAIAGTVASMLYVVYSLFSAGEKPFPQEYSGKTQKEHSQKKDKPKPRSTRDLKKLKEAGMLPQAFMESQSAIDQNNLDIMRKVIKRNTYTIYLPGASNPSGSILFVKGRIALMPRHFVTLVDLWIQDDEEVATAAMKLCKTSSDVTFKVELQSMLNIVSDVGLDALDLVCVEFPPHITNHANITNYFVKRQDLAKVAYPDFRLTIPRPDSVTNWIGKAERIDSVHVNAEHPYVIQKAFRYRAPTTDGDCGGVFSLMNPHIPNRKICGIHTAGLPSLGLGMSSVITFEDLEETLVDVPFIQQEFEPDTLPQIDSKIHDGTFCALYKAPVPVPQVFASEIKKSPLFDAWGPHTTLPARLREFEFNGEVIDPYVQAIQGFQPVAPFVSSQLIATLADNVLGMLESTAKEDVPRDVISTHEAITGIFDDNEFKAVSKSTSMGYPYNTMADSKKSHYFGSEPGYDFSSEKAINLINKINTLAAEAELGIRREHIFTSTIKDERRKIAKVQSGSSRLFEASEFDLLILHRKYFGRFVSWMQKNRIDNGSAVGINPFSAEWNLLAEKLNSYGNASTLNKGAGDYEKYDKLLYPVIQNAVLDLINKWYNDKYALARKVLFLEITNTRHIRGDIVFEDFFSNPSGVFLTTTLNILANHIAANYAWFRSNSNSLASISQFYKNVYFVAFGDDNAFSVAMDKTKIFNEQVMSDYVKELGMKYTNENKTAVSSELRPITQISFLKRGFRVIPQYNRFGAPLELGVILEMPYWTKKGIHSEEIVHDNVDCALRELSLHPKEVFDTWAPKIITACKERMGFVPSVTSQFLLLASIDGREDFY